MGSAMGDDKSQLSLANRSVSNYIPKNHDNTPDQKNYNNLRSNNNDLTPNTIEYKEKPELEMKNVILKFPHLMEQIIQKLDDKSLVKSREAARITRPRGTCGREKHVAVD